MKITRLPLWVTATNSYVVYEEGTGIVIDAPPDPEAVGALLADLGVAVTGILLTHGHVDHTGGAGWLARKTSAAVYVHPDDDYLTLHPERQLQRLFGGMLPPGSYEQPDRYQDLEDGQTLELAGTTVGVLHTPGHTRGHCCFHLPEEDVLFSGDQLFAGSVGRTDLEGGSFEALMRSMEDKVLSLPDETVVLPGHGPDTTVGRERETNPFLTRR